MLNTLSQLETRADFFLRNGIVKTELWEEISRQLSQRAEYILENTPPEIFTEAQSVIDRREEEFKRKYRVALNNMPSFPVTRMIFCLDMIDTLASDNPQTIVEYDDIFSFWEISNAAMQVYIAKKTELFDRVNISIVRDFSEVSLQEGTENFISRCASLKNSLLIGASWDYIFAGYIHALHDYEKVLILLCENKT